MLTRYVNADLLGAEQAVIVHGCNNKGVWGAGVAKALAERWPKVFNVFQYAHVSGALGLGSVVWAPRDPAETRWVASIVTQQGYGKDPNVRYVSYDAVERGLMTVVLEARERGYVTAEHNEIAIPMIGAGLGRGDWDIILSILRSVARRARVRFAVYVPDEELYKNLQREEARDESVPDRPKSA